MQLMPVRDLWSTNELEAFWVLFFFFFLKAIETLW